MALFKIGQRDLECRVVDGVLMFSCRMDLMVWKTKEEVECES
jgi:hypothetical protein